MNNTKLYIFAGVGALILTSLVEFDKPADAKERRPRAALAIESELNDAGRLFSRDVTALSPYAPDYWRRVWRAWEASQIKTLVREFDLRLQANARNEAEKETGVPQ